ncbi:hypothetical protein [Paenibacillus sp. S25]|uniref:hypothetical protein n=1 Tax=Paenibacillus sp. S25 TaxID=2823905 RepID=UPI001C645DDD|nr:hypothetical protein [Paenibacillus sp. S25]QYK61824.1 hypothetical protein KAI37_02148 [Paenibacillus sp. S25]
MERLITTIRCVFRLFKQPHKIGATFTLSGTSEPMLVIGIEKYELWHDQIIIWYTCQRLDHEAPTKMVNRKPRNYVVELEIEGKYDDVELKRYGLGSTILNRGQYYKIQEYTEIALRGTDLVISFMARPIYPVGQKEVKEKLFGERRKKLKIL